MTRRNLYGCTLLCAAFGFALSMPSAALAQPKEAEVKLGMDKSFFKDLPDVVVGIVTEPFGDLLKETTGLKGNLVVTSDAYQTAAQLGGKLQFGVFHGHEFAWAQKKYPDLRPLMVITNAHDDVRAYIIVPKNSPAKTIADLRGKTIQIPLQTRQHCWVYLERHCGDNAQSELKSFFKAILRAESPVIGLNDVCQGKADAMVVDTIDLEFYKEVKGPVFTKNLRILQQSAPFPAAVIAYKQGAVTDATLKQFHDGLLTAHNNPAGGPLMKLWNIKAFETVPKTYTQSLADVLKAYPVPETTKISMR